MIRTTLLLSLVFAVLGPSLKAADKPNVIVIFCDDLGWADLGALATVTVHHNNVLMQDHLNPVRFRNIWFKPSR